MKHRLGFGLYGGIKAIKIGFYSGDKAGNYFLFISILKLYEKFKKNYDNDITANVAQGECNNIKCYTSALDLLAANSRCVGI